MSLIVTPGQLEKRAELYHQLGSLVAAGVPIVQALEQLYKQPPARSFRDPLSVIIEGLRQGHTFTNAVSLTGSWMPSFDVALISAGEKSGRLDACTKLLAAYYRSRALIARQVISNLAYPMFILHCAILVFPMGTFTGLILQSQYQAYLLSKIYFLPFYAVIIFLLYACQGKRGESWRSNLEHFTRIIPVLGKARRDLALARLAAALEALISAGAPVFDAWELASVSSGSPALRRRVYSWRSEMENGKPPSQMLSASYEFPEMFANMYHTGEVSGQLDDALRRLNTYYQEEGSRKLQLFAQWVPRMIYMIIALGIGYHVISFYQSYFNSIDQLTK